MSKQSIDQLPPPHLYSQALWPILMASDPSTSKKRKRTIEDDGSGGVGSISLTVSRPRKSASGPVLGERCWSSCESENYYQN